MGERFLVTAPRLVTCDPARATADDALGVLEDGAFVVDDERVSAVGAREDLERRFPRAKRIEHLGVVTPGLVDAHTHAPYVGSRHAEYAARMAGAGYEEIARVLGIPLGTVKSRINRGRLELAKRLLARRRAGAL